MTLATLKTLATRLGYSNDNTGIINMMNNRIKSFTIGASGLVYYINMDYNYRKNEAYGEVGPIDPVYRAVEIINNDTIYLVPFESLHHHAAYIEDYVDIAGISNLQFFASDFNEYAKESFLREYYERLQRSTKGSGPELKKSIAKWKTKSTPEQLAVVPSGSLELQDSPLANPGT